MRDSDRQSLLSATAAAAPTVEWVLLSNCEPLLSSVGGTRRIVFGRNIIWPVEKAISLEICENGALVLAFGIVGRQLF